MAIRQLTDMKREKDIEELLNETYELLQQIKSTYEIAKTNEDIITIAKPKVKSCLEHLRSSLDYIAVDIYESYNNNKKDVYFPYGKNKKVFIKSLNKNLPNLDSKYVSILESVQPYICNDKWLINLCRITNFNKHVELQKCERVNSNKLTTRVGNIGTVEGSGTLHIGKIVVNGVCINSKGPLIITDNQSVKDIESVFDVPVQVRRNYNWVKFTFKGTNIDVVLLLDKSLNKIRMLTKKIYI